MILSIIGPVAMLFGMCMMVWPLYTHETAQGERRNESQL